MYIRYHHRIYCHQTKYILQVSHDSERYKNKIVLSEMSDLNSFDWSQNQLSELIKLVQNVDLTKNIKSHEKYAELGRKYLSTIMTDIIYFQSKSRDLQIKNPSKFLSSDISSLITSKVLPEKDSKKLEIAMGKLYKSKEKDMQTVHKVVEDLVTFVELQDGNQSQDKSSFLFDMSALSIIHSHEQPQFSEPTMTSFNMTHDSKNKFEKELSLLDDINSGDHVKNVQNFMNGLNGTKILSLLVQFKQKTFQLIETPSKTAPFKYINELKFTNFLGQGEIITFAATREGSNKQEAREKTNKDILMKFFKATPYVFKDFVHCMKSKGAL